MADPHKYDPNRLMDRFNDKKPAPDPALAELAGVGGPRVTAIRSAFSALRERGEATAFELNSSISARDALIKIHLWLGHDPPGAIPWLRNHDLVDVTGGVTVDPEPGLVEERPRGQALGGYQPTDELLELCVRTVRDEHLPDYRGTNTGHDSRELAVSLLSKWYTLLAASNPTPLHILEPFLRFGWNLPSLSRATSYRSTSGGEYYVEGFPDRERTIWDDCYWKIFPELPGVEGVDATSEYRLTYDPDPVAETVEDAEAEPADAEAD